MTLYRYKIKYNNLQIPLAYSNKSRIFATLLQKATRLDSLAQLVEHNTFNVGVLGSSPKRITEKKQAKPPNRVAFCIYFFVIQYP